MENKLNLIKLNMGEMLLEYLEDKNVNEIAVNDDSKVWISTFTDGWVNTGEILPANKITAIIRLIADYSNIMVDEDNPFLETELFDGSRFSASLLPISTPSFNLRKHSILVFSLEDYIEQKNITVDQKEIITSYIQNKKNILIVGSTSSGKTTFGNACINEISTTSDRIIIVEDTKELQCTVKNTLRLISSKKFPMVRVLEHCMRRTPERLIIGEVRGKEALYLLTAWNSGHGGGICTIHSETAVKGLKQLEQYIQRESVNPQKELIADNIHLIVVLAKENGKRKVIEIKKMIGLDEKNNYILEEVNC